jgi:hypothetical protein
LAPITRDSVRAALDRYSVIVLITHEEHARLSRKASAIGCPRPGMATIRWRGIRLPASSWCRIRPTPAMRVGVPEAAARAGLQRDWLRPRMLYARRSTRTSHLLGERRVVERGKGVALLGGDHREPWVFQANPGSSST